MLTKKRKGSRLSGCYLLEYKLTIPQELHDKTVETFRQIARQVNENPTEPFNVDSETLFPETLMEEYAGFFISEAKKLTDSEMEQGALAMSMFEQFDENMYDRLDTLVNHTWRKGAEEAIRHLEANIEPLVMEAGF